jgi:hypothetical protein
MLLQLTAGFALSSPRSVKRAFQLGRSKRVRGVKRHGC